MPRHIVTETEITENLRNVRASATPEHVREGRIWYRTMRDVIADMAQVAADDTGEIVPLEMACEIVASMSQNTSWADNLNRARKYLHGGMADGTGHLKRVMAECAEIEENGTADLGIKRNAFKRNLAGDESVHCSDRWALRAAYNLGQYDPEAGAKDGHYPKGIGRQRSKNPDGTFSPWGMNVPLTETVQALVQAAAETVAAEYGETVAQCQAVIWCAIRGTGE